MPNSESLLEAYDAACRAIDDNDVAGLKRLITDFPGLLTFRTADSSQVLLQQTTSYANFPGAENEEVYNRLECAELLLDAGATVDPRVYLRMIDTGAHQMLALFDRKGVLPNNLRVVAALGNLARVKACFDDTGRLHDQARPNSELLTAYDGADHDWPPPDQDGEIIADAFLYACRLSHRPVAETLLRHCTAANPDLARRIQTWEGEAKFIEFLLSHSAEGARHEFDSPPCPGGPGRIWQRAVELRLQRTLQENDSQAFAQLLQAEPFLLGSEFLGFQVRVLETCAYTPDTREVIAALLDTGAAIASVKPAPSCKAISCLGV